MEREVFYSRIVDNEIFLPPEIVQYFSSSHRPSDIWTSYAVLNKGLKKNLTMYRLQDWKTVENILCKLDIRVNEERKAKRYFLSVAHDVEIMDDNKVIMSEVLSTWFRIMNETEDRELRIVMYISDNEDVKYECVIIRLESEYQQNENK